MKQDQWNKLFTSWQNDNQTMDTTTSGNDKPSSFKKLKSLFGATQTDQTETREVTELPGTELELKQYFLDQIYPIQLKWATSTVTDVSMTDQNYEHDKTLKFFLQRLSDIYLVMYYPIFNIKQAPVDGDIILISPVGIEIIYLIEESEDTTIFAGDNRIWTTEKDYVKTNMISPMIALKRTEHVVKSILKKYDIDVPIYKTILSRKNNIVFSDEPYMTRIVGRFQYEDWFLSKRRLTSTLKSWQLKAADVLLNYCLTMAVKRPEWEEKDGDIDNL